MNLTLNKYGASLGYGDGLPVIPDILPGPNYSTGDILVERYEIRELFHGAAGDVYHCFDIKNKTDVALKTVIRINKTDRTRMYSFYTEVERRFQLPTHPNVLTLKRIENIDGYYFIISEWVTGDSQLGNSITTWLERYSFSLPEIVNFMQQMCSGLTHCHKYLASGDKPYAFGDLKPDNVLIDKCRILKLADFSGGFTPGWDAPEQTLDSTVTPDVRTDIFCLGKIASAMLAKIPATEDDFWCAVDDLLRSCLHPRIEYRLPSLLDLSNQLNSICAKFQCTPYREPASKADTFMDRYDRLVSAMNLGHYIPSDQTLLDQAYAHSLIRKKYISLEEYKEYTAGDDRCIYQAMADYLHGNLSGALKRMQDILPARVHSAEFYYRRATFLCAAGKLDEALRDLNAAISKELYLPACDLKANILLDFPQYAAAHYGEISVLLDKLTHLPASRFAGYLLDQIIGKYYMLAGMVESASSHFRKSLQYVNLADEWLTLYYYASCESRQGHSENVRMLADQAIQLILCEPQYLSHAKKCLVMLFSNDLLGNCSEVIRMVKHIKDTFGFDYSNMLSTLQKS